MLALLLIGFGTQSADAQDSILFPYFSSGGGDMTFIQIVNGDFTREDNTLQDKLHYTYVYNTVDEICVHVDENGNTSRNDILLYEVKGAYAGQLLTGPPADTTSTSPILTAVKASTGYLIVDQTGGNIDSAASDEPSIWGQAFVVNVDNGTVFAYNAINDPDENSVAGGLNEFYDNSTDTHVLSFMPIGYADTTYYFFPVESGTDLSIDGNQFLDTYITIGDDAGGVFNNNESLKSGMPYLPIGCWDEDPSTGDIGNHKYFFYTLDQIMSDAVYQLVKNTGGWTDDYYDDWGYSYKIMTSNVLGKPMSTILYEPHRFDSEESYTK